MREKIFYKSKKKKGKNFFVFFQKTLTENPFF